MTESVALIEPLMPPVGNRRLEDLAGSVIGAASSLKAFYHPLVAKEISRVISSMNCYYSNLIEGHKTLPVDIEKAINRVFSENSSSRTLQLEALAHIEVQKLIALNCQINSVVSSEYIAWIHREFCCRLPEELLLINAHQGQKNLIIVPGQFRTGDVIIGQHIPITSESIPKFLKRFEEGYNPSKLSLIQKLIAVAASHHRLLWIHPFYDGNGRVARLFSDAFLCSIGIGNGLWSISRGLARNLEDYRIYLALADKQRWNDLDGRGNLSLRGLIRFCEFFLETCWDQIKFMSSLLEPNLILNRLEISIEEEIRKKNLLPGSYNLVKQVWLEGEIARGRVSQITGYGERQGRSILKKLIENNWLVSNTPKSPVRLFFTTKITERIFPSL
jgi:Fic family protein